MWRGFAYGPFLLTGGLVSPDGALFAVLINHLVSLRDVIGKQT